jgi:hypothetical protein
MTYRDGFLFRTVTLRTSKCRFRDPYLLRKIIWRSIDTPVVPLRLTDTHRDPATFIRADPHERTDVLTVDTMLKSLLITSLSLDVSNAYYYWIFDRL